MLKMTNTELELLLDIDMHLFIEKGMRGGTSCTAKIYDKDERYDKDKRYDKRYDNKCMKCYDANKPSRFIT